MKVREDEEESEFGKPLLIADFSDHSLLYELFDDDNGWENVSRDQRLAKAVELLCLN